MNHKSQRTDKCLSSLTWPWEIFLMGDTPGKNLGKPDDPVPVLVMLQKQGWSTSCYASTRRINSCMQKFQSKQGDRSKDISLLDEPKDVDSTDSHTQKSIVCSPSPQQCTPPSMDHWMEARTCSWRDAFVDPVLWDLQVKQQKKKKNWFKKKQE